MKKYIKQISFFLIFLMLFTYFPTKSFATDILPNVENTNASDIIATVKPGKIVKEIVEKREKNVKHFLKDDGTYEAVIYPKPVHYFDNGKWQDIDNSLIEIVDTDVVGNKVLSTKQNDYNVKIDSNLSSKKLVSIEKDKYKIEWNIENAKTNQSQIQPSDEKVVNNAIEKEVNNKVDSDYKIKNKAEVKAVLIENAKKETLKNISSQVNFSDIFTNVDLEYIVDSDTLKENIILKKQTDLPVFTFNINVKNLIPKIQKDNSIIFYDNENSNKAVFNMDAPFMVDANKESSNQINVLLEGNTEGYTLTIKPDTEWLNSSNRTYPVTIDPPIGTSLNANDIQDAFISQSLPNNNYQLATTLGVGKGTTTGVTRSFMKFVLPSLSSGSIITNAQLYLSLETSNAARQINAHKVNGDWNSSTLIWNNAPSYNSKIEDYQLINDSVSTDYYWDVTSIVKDWYNTGNNYGLMIKANDETSGYNDFLSSDCSSTYASWRPQVVLNYVNNSGLESYWTYHSQTVNRAGTSYINDYNGNLIFQHDDLSMSGSKMPVNINHVYNSNDRSSSLGYGNGWRLNLNQRVTIENINGASMYCYTDEDGTKHYFYYESPSTYKDRSGVNITLTANADGSYIIKDKSDNQLKFVPGGYLHEIIDNNGNTLTLSYTGIVLSKIIDGAGRVTILDSTPQGYLLGITDPAGRRTSFAYNGINLDTITYPDGKQTKYTYDVNNNLTSALNYDGYKVIYGYNSGIARRVINVKESHTDGTLGGETSIGYGNNVNTFTDVVTGRKDTFQFNYWGNTVSTIDSQGNATYTSYNEETNDPKKNKANVESKLQKTTVNYIRNHNAEVSSDWNFDYWGQATGTAAYTTEAAYLGKQSIKVAKANTNDRLFYNETLSLVKGKTYIFSAYEKTSGISNVAGQGAAIFVTYQNSAGAWLNVDSKYVNGTNDWQRTEVTFTLPSDAASTTVYARVGVIGESGTAYFDSLQLEDGSVANRYNLIENPDFRGNSFSYWNKGGDCDGNDILGFIDPSTNPVYSAANIDGSSFKINGASGKSKNVYQTLNVSGGAEDTFVVSGWAKADSVPTTSGRYFAIDVGFQQLDGSYVWVVVPFNQDSSDWQYISSVVKPNVPYKSINVYGLYYNNANAACFDGFRLYKEEFGDSYTYDSNGNLASTKDVAKQNSSFAYNTKNDLITSSDPKGSQFKYEYDNNDESIKKHNLTKAASAENVVYSFTYDSSGNPLTSKVGDGATYINSSATYTTSGNYLNTITDSMGNTVTNNWDETKGILNNVIDPKGNTTSYAYDSLDRLENVSKTVDGSTVSNIYGYTNDRLSTITQNGFNYSFGYDSLGNNKTVSVGTQNLITNSFEGRTGKLLNSTYGNGQIVSNGYDDLDRVIAKKYNNDPRYTYEYDASGNVGYQKDIINGTSYRYVYDTADRLMQLKDSTGNILSYSYDINNNKSKISEKINGTTYDTNYAVDKDNKPTTTTYNKATANIITPSIRNLKITNKTSYTKARVGSRSILTSSLQPAYN
jgi:YD repeat-containing protein